MPVTNPFSITYNGLTVGGSSGSYQLLGAYVIERNYERIRLGFDVLVVAETQDSLRSLSETLEETLSARDKTFRVTINGTSFTFTPGTNVLNVVASIAKSGSPSTDKSHSRSYSVNIEAGVVETDNDGLRDISTVVALNASGIATVTFSGIYTAQESITASENYVQKADAECSGILATLRGEGATFELVDETYTPDRNDHICQWQRQYRQIVYNQSSGLLDDDRIRDHRVTFQDLWQQPGDSAQGITRLRRVDAMFDASVVLGESTPSDVWESVVRQFLIDEFIGTFGPGEWAIEESRSTYDQTGQRLSATMRFVFSSGGAANVIELSQSVTYRESRTIDYTPVHSGQETAAYVDPGWATIERIWIRAVEVIGDEMPRRRLHQEGGGGKQTSTAGDFVGPIGGIAGPDSGGTSREIQPSGWNIVGSSSQVAERWIGHPEYGQQFKVTTLNETVTERYNTRPSAGGTTPGGR